MPDVQPDWTQGSAVAYAAAHAIGVLVSKVSEADAPEDVAAVVKDGSGQLAHDLERKAQLGVQYQQLMAARRNADQSARRLVGGVAAHRDRSLRSGSVERESTQGASTTGEEVFTERYVGSPERFFNPRPHAVGP